MFETESIATDLSFRKTHVLPGALLPTFQLAVNSAPHLQLWPELLACGPDVATSFCHHLLSLGCQRLIQLVCLSWHSELYIPSTQTRDESTTAHCFKKPL